MAFTLSELLQEGYKRLGQFEISKATGGTATSILDSLRNGEDGDNAWDAGAAFVISTTDGLAPAGEFSRISTSVGGTWALTLADTLTAAVGAGDTYGFASPEYSLFMMVELANTALMKLGDLDLVDTATLDGTTNTTEYAASVDWKYPYGPTQVDIAQGTDTDNYRWVMSNNWYYEPATAGSGGKIIFREYPYSGRDIRVWYRGPHPRVESFDDVIDQRFNKELVAQSLVQTALEWNNSRSRGADDFLIGRQNQAAQDFAEAKFTSPPVKQGRRSKLLILGSSRNTYPGDRNPV